MTPPAAATTLSTPAEAAQRLRVGIRTVYRLVESGDLRAVNVAAKGGTRLRIREDDLAAFIETRTASATAPSIEDALAASS
jgi:excisionase family DNA binding protein